MPENTEPLQPGPLTAQNSSPQGALQQRVDTAQLLQGTENILKGINRSLNGDEQAIVQHIHSYMQQSRSATNDGDSELAYKLAVKAHLMADELAKR